MLSISKALIPLFLLFPCLLLSLCVEVGSRVLSGSVFGPCFVMPYLLSYLVLQSCYRVVK